MIKYYFIRTFTRQYTETGGLAPTSGAATFKYSDVNVSGVMLRTAVGPFWSTGSSDMLDSWGTWNSTKGVAMNTTDANLADKCLIFDSANFPPAQAARDALPVLNNSFWTSEQGKNQLCVAPLSHVTANYTYVYSAAEMGDFGAVANASRIEEGGYNTPVMFQSGMGQGIVTIWNAKTVGTMHGEWGWEWDGWRGGAGH